MKPAWHGDRLKFLFWFLLSHVSFSLKPQTNEFGSVCIEALSLSNFTTFQSEIVISPLHQSSCLHIGPQVLQSEVSLIPILLLLG